MRYICTLTSRFYVYIITTILYSFNVLVKLNTVTGTLSLSILKQYYCQLSWDCDLSASLPLTYYVANLFYC